MNDSAGVPMPIGKVCAHEGCELAPIGVDMVDENVVDHCLAHLSETAKAFGAWLASDECAKLTAEFFDNPCSETQIALFESGVRHARASGKTRRSTGDLNALAVVEARNWQSSDEYRVLRATFDRTQSPSDWDALLASADQHARMAAIRLVQRRQRRDLDG